MDPRLLFISGLLKGKVIRIQNGKLRVGRAADNAVCIPDRLMSKYQFEIEVKDGKAVLYDRQTRNGTWINSFYYGHKTLEHGDRIECANTAIIYLDRPDLLDAAENLNRSEERRVGKECRSR